MAIKRADILGALAYLVIWGGSVGYLAHKGADWTFPLISLGIFGIALSLLAWLLTLGAKPPEIPVKRPALETGALVIFLALYATVFLVWGMNTLRHALPPGREQELLVLGVKLLVHVGLPVLLLMALGGAVRPLLGLRIATRSFWLTFIVLGAVLLGLLSVVSPSLKQIADLHAPVTTLAWAGPAFFLWIALEAGLCEEFLFRAVLQTRLSALFNSAIAGVLVTSLLFGLAHFPGLYLRGNTDVDGWSTDPFQVIAYTIATLSPISLLFGFIYARTKSLLLVVLLHACVDVLPNLADFVRMWS